MKIAVITPYYQETADILKRCYASVRAQTYRNFVHMMIADGEPHPMVRTLHDVEHMVLPRCHDDAGATPRALAAISAFSLGFDAVAFLDADNTYLDNHLEIMASAAGTKDVVTATRNICTSSGRFLYVDDFESDGIVFCDTNCLFIKKSVLHLLTNWITAPEHRLWSDRQFWASLVNPAISRLHINTPTVNYHSRWAWHYQHAGLVPPPDSVWIDKTVDGRLIQTKHNQG